MSNFLVLCFSVHKHSAFSVSSVCWLDDKWPLVHLFNFCGQYLSLRHSLLMCQPVEIICLDICMNHKVKGKPYIFYLMALICL